LLYTSLTFYGDVRATAAFTYARTHILTATFQMHLRNRKQLLFLVGEGVEQNRRGSVRPL